MFTCPKCRQSFDDALKLQRRKVCKGCYSMQLRAYKDQNREAVQAWNAAYRAANRDQINAWRSRHRDAINPVQNAWRDKNRDAVRATARQRHRERMESDALYVEKVKAWQKLVRSLRERCRQAPIAKAYAAETKAFYAARPSGLHVDHIEPLISRNACGLHVPWNLQYLPHAANQQKSNRLLK